MIPWRDRNGLPAYTFPEADMPVVMIPWRDRSIVTARLVLDPARVVMIPGGIATSPADMAIARLASRHDP